MKTVTKQNKRLKLPDGLLDGIVYECLNEAQKFIFLLLLFQAAQSMTPGCLLLPFNAFDRFTQYDIDQEILYRTLYALQTHELVNVTTYERLHLFFVEIVNWGNYEVH